MSLQKQCSKLHELKAKSLIAEEEVRRIEMEREKLLVAQPVTSGQSGSTHPEESPVS